MLPGVEGAGCEDPDDDLLHIPAVRSFDAFKKLSNLAAIAEAIGREPECERNPLARRFRADEVEEVDGRGRRL